MGVWSPISIRATLAVVVACAFVPAACGGGGDELAPLDVSPQAFMAAPAQTLATASGRLSVEARYLPQPAVRGANAVQLTLADAGGGPAGDLTIAVTPWMPSHGHGTSVQPVVTTDAADVFVANPLYLYMSGRWELRMTIGGAVDDTLTAIIEIP